MYSLHSNGHRTMQKRNRTCLDEATVAPNRVHNAGIYDERTSAALFKALGGYVHADHWEATRCAPVLN